MRPILLLVLLGCAACAGRRPVPAAAAPPRPVGPSVVSPPIHPPVHQPLEICLVRGGELETVSVTYNTASGDTTYQGVPFSQAFPPGTGYAAQAEWYLTNEPIAFGPRHRYVKYGYPRVLDAAQVARVGEHHGVGIFVRAGDTEDPQVIYVPVRPGCEFQPYQVNVK